jgi:lysophospholipase L1-like esterase
MKDNLEKIKTEIQPIQLVLCTLPYSKVKTVMADAKVDEVNTIIKTFAKDNTLPVIDVHSEVTLKTTEYQVDGGHLTNSGYAKIAKNITSHIT